LFYCFTMSFLSLVQTLKPTPAVSHAVGFVGLLVILGFALTLLGAIWRLCLRPGKNLKKMGSWAVVTGATDGIGQAIALRLASQGINLVLISRTQSKLDATAELVQAKGVQVKTVRVDYGQFDQAAKERVSNAVSGLDVGVLVNNVGMSYDHPEYFLDLTEEKVTQLLKLNIESTTYMCRLVMPEMVQRRSGVVVNMSSLSGEFDIGTPFLAQYAAAKAYIAKLSMAMDEEYAPKGVRVQVLVPALVSTKLSKIRKSSLFTPSPQAFAKVAVASFGYESWIMPYWPHALQLWVLNVAMPQWLSSKLLNGMHLGLRKRALRKKNKNN